MDGYLPTYLPACLDIYISIFDRLSCMLYHAMLCHAIPYHICYVRRDHLSHTLEMNKRINV